MATGSHGAARDFQWTTYDRRPAPPPPSLPPWAAGHVSTLPPSTGMLNADPSQGWHRQPSHFGTLKRLPQRATFNELPSDAQNDDEEQHRFSESTAHSYNQYQDHRGEDATTTARHAGRRVDLPLDRVTNQVDEEMSTPATIEDDPATHEDPARTTNHEGTPPLEPSFIEPLPTEGAFFRPWKKTGNDDIDEASNNNCVDDEDGAASNKWKVRALLNPFAKRKGKQSVQAPPVAAAPVDDGADNPAEPSPVVRVPTKQQRPEQRSSTEPVRRPTTPPVILAAPAPISVQHVAPTPASVQQEPRRPVRPPLRSREAKLLPVHDDNDDANELPRALTSISDLRKSTTLLAPLQSSSRPPTRDEDEDNDDAVTRVLNSVPPKPPTQLQQLRQQLDVQKKGKKGSASTLNALQEIERKRQERRHAQAQEKQRIETELKQHGDDAGYKFRRLIQKYRDAMPAFQKAATVPATSLPSVSAAQRLSVFVRKRPLAKKELKAKGYDVLTCLFAGKAASSLRKELICHEPKLKVDCSESLENHQFHFDGVFDQDQENATVYTATVGPMLPFLVQPLTGASATTSLTVFAYGQTGSGKTYTMKSIYRQAAGDLFDRLATVPSASSVSVGVSFYEIYMNQVNDLLSGRTRVQMMEDGDGVVQLLGLKEITITSAEELMELIKIGEDARATSANAVHDDSSRSHAMLRVTIYAADTSVLARLSMVDLAGSERACDTQSDSKSTRMEGAEINKSLLALKECVRALDRGATHIPFRQSKLTQLLRDSFLCANSKTVMIATLSPCSESCNHTLNTLRYADRLKEIGGGT